MVVIPKKYIEKKDITMREVNNNPTGNPQNIPQVKVNKADAVESTESKIAFTGAENLKELDLENNTAYQAFISADNIDADLKFLQKHPGKVNSAIEFCAAAEKQHSPEKAAALMGEFTKEFLQ